MSASQQVLVVRGLARAGAGAVAAAGRASMSKGLPPGLRMLRRNGSIPES